MAIYKILVSKSVGVYYDVEANSEDEAIDKFIKLQPYASGTLNSSTGLWEAPVAYPETYTSGVADDGVTAQTHPDSYDWDETNQQWTKRL